VLFLLIVTGLETDLNLIRRDIGQITLVAGMTDDTMGWILLSIVAGLATSGTIDFVQVFRSVSGAVLFLAVAFTIGLTVIAQILRWVDDTIIGGTTASLSALLIMAFAAAALTHALGNAPCPTMIVKSSLAFTEGRVYVV
jgi:Kef-type K+ transport system membrane component KefB